MPHEDGTDRLSRNVNTEQISTSMLRLDGDTNRTPLSFMFEFSCVISLYYIKNQQDATLAVLFISHCKITLHVSDAFCVSRVLKTVVAATGACHGSG